MLEFASTVYKGSSLIISGGAEKDKAYSNHVFKLDFKLIKGGKFDGKPEKANLPGLGMPRHRHS